MLFDCKFGWTTSMDQTPSKQFNQTGFCSVTSSHLEIRANSPSVLKRFLFFLSGMTVMTGIMLVYRETSGKPEHWLSVVAPILVGGILPAISVRASRLDLPWTCVRSVELKTNLVALKVQDHEPSGILNLEPDGNAEKIVASINDQITRHKQ